MRNRRQWYLLQVELRGAPIEAFDYYIVTVNAPLREHSDVLAQWQAEQTEEHIKSGKFHRLPASIAKPALSNTQRKEKVVFFSQLHKGVGYVESEPASVS